MKPTPRPSVLAAMVGMFTMVNTASAQNWIATSVPGLYWNSLASSANGTNLIAVGYSSFIYTSRDSGTTWSSNFLHTAAGGCTCVASSADGTKLLVGTVSDVLYTSTNSGITWLSNNVPARTWKSVASSADGSRLVAGSLGPIYTSCDSGATWVEHDVPVTEEYPYFVWGGLASSADGTKLAAAGYMPMNYALGHGGGLIYLSADSGISWRPSSAPNTNWCSIACSADGSTLIAATSEPPDDTYSSAIFTSTNSGSTWRRIDVPKTRNLQRHISVACSADGTRMVAAAAGFWSPGVILISTDSGLTWSSNSSPAGTWSAVTSSTDGGKLAAALYGGPIYTLTATLQPSLCITSSGREVVVSWFTPSSDFMLEQSPDLGAHSWTRVAAAPTLTNLQERVTMPLLPGAWYYRLKSL
jgi:photosystem II stability/assembly factor-like uncharacterized protein